MHKLIYGKREEEGAQAQKVFSFHFFGRYATFPILAFKQLDTKSEKGNFFSHFCSGRQSGREREKDDL